jgi:hypothetical protein
MDAYGVTDAETRNEIESLAREAKQKGWLENYTDATYLDRPDGVRAYTHLWNRLQAAAMGQVESRHMILRLADAA